MFRRSRLPAYVSHSLFLSMAMASLASSTAGQDVNPTPSPNDKCPNGSSRLIWNYPADGGLPPNATPVKCDNPAGCYSMPYSACLQLVDVPQQVTTDVTPVVLDPASPSVVLPDPSRTSPLDQPQAERPVPVVGNKVPVPTPGADGCRDGTGWDFEEIEHGEDELSLFPVPHAVRLHPEAVHGSMEGWRGDDPLKFPNSPFTHQQSADEDRILAPVYGNAAPIDGIRPPGWRPDIAKNIGGDYWKYSEPVNQSGDFWISSLYRRYSWGQHPGDTYDETATGTLTSPECKLNARYLTFRMGGARSSSQRIELQVYYGSPLQYFGIRFPGLLGDTTLPAHGHFTQSVSVPAVPQSFPPVTGHPWTVERSVTSEDTGQSDWMQTYVFDLKPFRGRRVRIRIVDDSRSECATSLDGKCLFMHPEHINADDFVFADKPPSGVTWLRFDENRCNGIPGVVGECSPVGVVPSKPPLWGITDVHAHPMANIGFGGHVIWGDVTDSLDAVYSCQNGLPPIAGPGGRDAIAEPVQSHACYLAGDVIALVAGEAIGACKALTVVPIVGLGVSELCEASVAAGAVASLSTPMIHGLDLHGAGKFSSGAVEMESVLFGAWQATENTLGLSDRSGSNFAVSPGLLPEFDKWPNAKPTVDWYRDPDPTKTPKWHSLHGINKSHNAYQKDMIERAFQGGMRLGVWDVINSRSLAYVADASNYSDWQALKDETDAAKRIVGSLSAIAEIAFSPADAIRIIQAGKLAVVLGSEVDELGRMRPEGFPWPRSPHSPGDSMHKQVDDLWELGIRKITPVHAVSSPIGGPALFDDKYVALNHFSNGTPMEGEDFSVSESPAVRFLIPRLPWLPFDIILGDFSLFTDVGGDAKTPWNPYGWFDFDLSPPPAIYGFDDPKHAVTFRVGQSDPKAKVLDPDDATKDIGSTLKSGPSWLGVDGVLDEQVLVERTVHDLADLFYPTGACSLLHTTFPDHAHSFGDPIDAHYTAVTGHRNALGLWHSDGGNDGEAFLRAAMKKGMILDVDHMSQKMRVEVYALANVYGEEAHAAAGWEPADLLPRQTLPPCSELSCDDYPFMGVHSSVRGLEREGTSVQEFRRDFGSADESMRTEEELAHVSRNGGTVGVFPRGSAFIPPNTLGGQCSRGSDCGAWSGPTGDYGCDLSTHTCRKDESKGFGVHAFVFYPPNPRDYALPREVKNDCDLSSKTFAVKYLYLMKVMGGRGLTLSTDMNGFLGMLDPRYGAANPSNTGFGGTPGKEVCGGNKREILDGRAKLVDSPSSPGTKVLIDTINGAEVSAQQIEHSAVWYEGYAARGQSDSSVAKSAGWLDKDWPPYRWKEVIARGQSEKREDMAPRYSIDEKVFFNTRGPELPIHLWYNQTGNRVGEQLWPMKQWKQKYAGWDFNLDGLQHIGLLPDLLQDMRNVGVQWEQMGPLFRGAQDFIDMWQRSVTIGSLHP
jgi:hypothetical protein